MSFAITIRTDLPPARIVKPWGRYPNAFLPDQQGGFALGGSRAFVIAGENQGGIVLNIANVNGTSPWVYLAFSTDTQERCGFLFKQSQARQQVEFLLQGNKYICVTENMEFWGAFTEGQVLDRNKVVHSVTGWQQAVGLPHYPGMRNPHYCVAAYLHHVYKLPVPKEQLAPVTPQELIGKVQEYDQFDKGSKQEAKELNQRLALPGRMKWHGKLSGVWLIQDKDGKLDILGAMVAHHFQDFASGGDKKFYAILQEQADLLKGAAGLLEVLIQLKQEL